MARIGIIGSAGRMGQALQAAIEAAGHDYAGGIDKGGDPVTLAAQSDVMVDFSAPGALEANLAAAMEAGVPVVVGTTGLSDAVVEALHGACATGGNASIAPNLISNSGVSRRSPSTIETESSASRIGCSCPAMLKAATSHAESDSNWTTSLLRMTDVARLMTSQANARLAAALSR